MHKEGEDDWTHQEGADNKTKVKQITTTGGKLETRGDTRRNRTFKVKV